MEFRSCKYVQEAAYQKQSDTIVWKLPFYDALQEIIPCEFEYKNLYSFGSLNTEKSAMSIWKGNVAEEFRKRFNMGNNKFYLCKDCVYKYVVDDDCTVEEINILPR